MRNNKSNGKKKFSREEDLPNENTRYTRAKAPKGGWYEATPFGLAKPIAGGRFMPSSSIPPEVKNQEQEPVRQSREDSREFGDADPTAGKIVKALQERIPEGWGMKSPKEPTVLFVGNGDWDGKPKEEPDEKTGLLSSKPTSIPSKTKGRSIVGFFIKNPNDQDDRHALLVVGCVSNKHLNDVKTLLSESPPREGAFKYRRRGVAAKKARPFEGEHAAMAQDLGTGKSDDAHKAAVADFLMEDEHPLGYMLNGSTPGMHTTEQGLVDWNNSRTFHVQHGYLSLLPLEENPSATSVECVMKSPLSEGTVDNTRSRRPNDNYSDARYIFHKIIPNHEIPELLAKIKNHNQQALQISEDPQEKQNLSDSAQDAEQLLTQSSRAESSPKPGRKGKVLKQQRSGGKVKYGRDDIEALANSLEPEDFRSMTARRAALADALREEGREEEADRLQNHIRFQWTYLDPTKNLDKGVRGHYYPYANGGYPLVNITKDGGFLCHNCANGENGSEAGKFETQDDPQWNIVGREPHYEGPPIQCDHCGTHIESAYGDPESEQDEE